MKMLTPHDIADLMQVSYETALTFIKTSGIAYIQVGRQYRVSERAYETFVAGDSTASVKSEGKDIYYNDVTKKPIKLRRR